MYGQHQQPLPYSAEQIQGPILSGLPHQVPFQPQVNVPPHLHSLVEPTLGALILELQNNARKNPLRTFLFNQMAANQYQNQDFNDMLMTVMEYAEFLMANTQGMPEQLLHQAIGEVCSMMASLNTQKFPALQGYIADEQTYNDVQRWLQKFSQIGQAIEQFQQQALQQQHQGYGPPQSYGYQPQHPQQPSWGAPAPSHGYGYQPQQPHGYGAPPAYGAPPQPWGAPPQSRGGYQQPLAPSRPSYQDMAMRSGPTQQPQHPQQHHAPMGGGQAYGRFNRAHNSPGFGPTQDLPSEKRMGTVLRAKKPQETQPEEEPTSFSAGPGAGASFGYQTGGQEEVAPKATEATGAAYSRGSWSTEIPEESTMQQGDNETGAMTTKGSYDEIIKPDGSIWRPAHKSGWEKTPNLEQPYTPAYDPTKEILFHRRSANGVVTEVLVEVNDENEYLLYELNPSFQKKVSFERQPDAKRVNWDKVGEGKTADEVAREREERMKYLKENTEVDEGDIPETDDLSFTVPLMMANSMEEASLGGSLNILNSLDEIPTDVPIEYFYYQCMPFLGDRNLVEPMEKLFNCTTFENAIEVLKGLKGKVPERMWYVVHDSITSHVNEALKVNLQVPVTIDSIVDDYSDLINLLNTDYEGAYSKLLMSKAALIIQSNVRPMAGSMLNDYMKKLDFPINDPSVADNIVVIGQLNSVTEVPWLSTDIPLVISDESSSVLESRFPNLHGAIDKIFKRASRVRGGRFRNHYILTRDNVKLKVYEGYVGKGFYLIGKA